MRRASIKLTFSICVGLLPLVLSVRKANSGQPPIVPAIRKGDVPSDVK